MITEIPAADRAWFIAQRWQEYRAERRANLLRIIAVGAFYAIHLWSYSSAQSWLPQLGFLQLAGSGTVSREFHVAVTLLAVAWSMLALGIWQCLNERFFPRWLPYISTGCDVVLLTSIIGLGSGPHSPLVAGYFLVLAVAALRLSLPLVRFATVASALGYLFVLGWARWGATIDEAVAQTTVPRYHQAIVLLAVVLTGVALGQLVRRARQVAEEFASRASKR